MMDDGLYQRALADGRTVFVFPLTFSRARIAIGDEMFLDDMW